MAFGKARGSKRTSSSHASTITVLIFLGLCAVAVWMLSSNTFVPPQIMRVATNNNDEPPSKKPESNEQPCLDNEDAITKLRSRSHYEHRERHCPEDPPTCLVPLPEGYKESHTKLAEVKGHQNWVKVTGEFLTFPGGGTQFIHGALHYIDFSGCVGRWMWSGKFWWLPV